MRAGLPLQQLNAEGRLTGMFYVPATQTANSIDKWLLNVRLDPRLHVSAFKGGLIDWLLMYLPKLQVIAV
jgi:hypothetical protein